MINIQAGTISRCHNYLDSIGKINRQGIQNTSQDVRMFLREVTPKRLKELAKLNCFAADKVKTELDKKYGANNYIVVAIGRSLSSIAELLSYMGIDTKIIPLSGLRKRVPDDIRKDDLHIYKTFLVQKGLSKTDLKKNKDKTYVLMDYTYYGRSLKRAEELLKQKELLGNAENITAMPICNALGEDYEKRYFKTLFSCNRFKYYAYVGKLHVDNLINVYDVCSPERVKEYQGNINQGMRKLFWFNVFDSLLNEDYKDIIPRTEVNALQKHYYSPEAIRNYIERERARLDKINKMKKKE